MSKPNISEQRYQVKIYSALRSSLRRLVGSQYQVSKDLFKEGCRYQDLTYEELSTFVAEIEACMNFRPLFLVTGDPEDPIALTPGHALVGR